MMETVLATQSESENCASDFSYDVVESPADAEFDLRTLNAFGVISRSDQNIANLDECSGDETYEKQVIVAADEVSTSPKTVCVPDETNLLAHRQSPSLQVDDEEVSQCDVGVPGACSPATATDNSCGYMDGCEIQLKAELGDEGAAAEDTLKKELDVNMTLLPAASADDTVADGDGDDDDDDDDDSADEQCPSANNEQTFSAEVQSSCTAGSPENDKSIHFKEEPMQRMTNDASVTGRNNGSNFITETMFNAELLSDTSNSLQPESHLAYDGASAQPDVYFNNLLSGMPRDQHTSTYWSRFRGPFFWFVETSMLIYRCANV